MDNQKSEKYKSLVNTAKQLFFKYGVKRVTLKEICESSGVSKVTFYSYFNDKEQLVKLIHDELMETGFSKFDEINRMDLSYKQKTELMTQWRIEYFKSMSNEFIKEILDADEIELALKQRYLNSIKIAQEKGEIDKQLNPELIWLVAEKLNDIVREGKWQEAIDNHTEVQKQLRQMYFYGLLNNND